MSGIVNHDPYAAGGADSTPESQLRPISIKQLEPYLGGPAKGLFVRPSIDPWCGVSEWRRVDRSIDR